MTTIQLQVLMGVLGVAACVLIAVCLQLAKRRVLVQWVLGLLGGACVALSPLSRFWRNPDSQSELVSQSALLSVVGLLATLLFALMTRRATQPAVQAAVVAELPATSVPTPETANRADHVIDDALALDRATTVRIDADRPTAELPDPLETESSWPAYAPARASTEDAVAVSANRRSVDQPTPHDERVPINEQTVEVIRSTDHIPLQSAANDVAATGDTESDPDNDAEDSSFGDPHPVASEEQDDLLDLTDSERLYAEIRDQAQPVDLPDDDDWRGLHNHSSEFDSREFDQDDEALLVSAGDELDSSFGLSPMDSPIDEASAIVEAEIVDVVDVDESLNFGDDLTGEYAHPTDARPTAPDTGTVASEPDEDPNDKPPVEVPLPATLDDALNSAQQSAAEIQLKLSQLQSGNVELSELRNSHAIEHCIDQLFLARQLMLKDQLLETESQTLTAAEELIAAQRTAFSKAVQRHKQTEAALKKERLRLIAQHREVIRSRHMAREAAQLARKAALAQQAIRDVARREQEKRVRSQESARKAMNIARDAIDALNAGERRKFPTHS